MGTRGPVPKRSSERLTKDPTRNERVSHAPSGTSAPVEAPPENPNWHHLAKSWYRSLQHSGMARFYEPSDWVQAALIANTISDELQEKFVGMSKETGDPVFTSAPMNPQTLAGILKASATLGVTEGDRRRMGVELTRADHEAQQDAKILSIVRDEEDAAFG